MPIELFAVVELLAESGLVPATRRQLVVLSELFPGRFESVSFLWSCLSQSLGTLLSRPLTDAPESDCSTPAPVDIPTLSPLQPPFLSSFLKEVLLLRLGVATGGLTASVAAVGCVATTAGGSGFRTRVDLVVPGLFGFFLLGGGTGTGAALPSGSSPAARPSPETQFSDGEGGVPAGAVGRAVVRAIGGLPPLILGDGA